jgi:hypothetical protein
MLPYALSHYYDAVTTLYTVLITCALVRLRYLLYDTILMDLVGFVCRVVNADATPTWVRGTSPIASWYPAASIEIRKHPQKGELT